MALTLTDEQSRYAVEIMEVLRARGACVLAGYAGTGKTTTTAHVVSTLRAEGLSVVVAAPTHRAAAVLGARLDGVDVWTIHAALGLYMRRGPDGEMVAHRSAVGGPATAGADVLVVDEVSMLGREMWWLVRAAAEGLGLLLVGDPAQLPPVGEDSSPVWTEVQSQYRLTRILRQSDESRILPLTALIRDRLEAGVAVRLGDLEALQGPDVRVMAASVDDVGQWVQRSQGRARMLSHTNARVDRGNAAAHYAAGRSRIGVGDAVFFGSPVVARDADGDTHVVISNGAESVVTDEGGEDHIAGVDVRWIRVGCYGSPIAVSLDPEGHRWRLAILADRVRRAWRAKDPEHGEMLRTLSAWQDMIADVRLGYALTIHRSQGSTYDTVYLDWRSIRWSDPAYACRLLYVAATRPSRRLCVFY